MASNLNARLRFHLLLALASVPLTLALPVPAAQAAAAHAYSDAEIRSVENSRDRQVRDIRDQEITQLRIALGRRLPGNRRADLYLRLAEIYYEAYRMEFLLEGRVHEQRLEAGKEDPWIHRERSKKFLALGVAACKDILRAGLPFEKMDQVLYFLAFNHGELGNTEESIRHFEELLKKFPRSPFTGEALIALGDVSFGRADYRKAQDYYERASSVRRDNARVFHKLAWAYYRTKGYEKAISAMKDAILIASKEGERFVSLRDEALRDMAIFMTESGKVEDAIAYFESVAGDRQYFPKVLERLGRQYERNADPVKAIRVYESLLKAYPEEEPAFRVRVKLVDLDLRRGKPDAALGRLQNVEPTRYASEGESDTQTAYKNLRALVRKTATSRHEAFRKKGAKDDLATAEKFYSVYLARFLAKDDPRQEGPEIQMYLADVKRDLGKPKEASELYKSVVASKDKRYAKEAATLWTASLAELIRKTAPQKAGEKPTELEHEFVRAADDLESALEGSAEAREASLKAAQVLAGYASTREDAAERSERITKKYPQSSQGVTAARLRVQVLADAGNPDDLVKVVKELRADSPLLATDGKSGGKLQALLAEQEFKLKIGTIAAQEKQKDFNSAALGYEQVAAESTQREVSERAFANAMGAHLKAGDPEKMEAALDRVSAAWLKKHSDSAQALESIKSAATVCLIQGRFEAAGALFERVGRTGRDAVALDTAARVFEGLGDGKSLARATTLWTDHLNLYKKAPGRIAILLALASHQESAHPEKAVALYKSCLEGPMEQQAECAVRLGDLYASKLKKPEEAKAQYKKVASLKGAYQGYARFRLAEYQEQELKVDPLALPESQLRKTLEKRTAAMEKLSKAYLHAVEAGGPWAPAALERLALWVFAFADDIDRIAPPASMDPAGVEQFRKNLGTISGPLRKQATQSLLQAYQKASASGILSPALPRIADRLAELLGETSYRAQGARGGFRFSGIATDGGEAGRQESLEQVRAKLAQNPKDASAWVDYGNLLTGSGKTLLGQMAYEQSLALAPSAAAQSNLGASLVGGAGEEDPVLAARAAARFREAIKLDAKDPSAGTLARLNLAQLLNYYRVYAGANPYWEQAVAKLPQDGIALDGRAIALFGSGGGKAEAIEAAFVAARKSEPSWRFAKVYHEAARIALKDAAAGEQCLARLAELEEASTGGFENGALESLKRTCEKWKTEKQ